MSPIEFAIFSYIVGFLLGFNPMLIGTFSTYLSSKLGRKYKYSRLNLAGFMFSSLLVRTVLLLV